MHENSSAAVRNTVREAEPPASRPASRVGFRPLRALLLVAVAIVGAALVVPACGTSSPAGTTAAATSSGGTGGEKPGTDGGVPFSCDGGVVVNGVCEGQCEKAKCVASDNTCVGNRCLLECTSELDCNVGQQECAPAKEDGTSASIMACQYTGKAGFGVACPFGGECAPAGTDANGKACTKPSSTCQETVFGACANGTACYLTGFVECQGGGACTKDEATCGNDPTCTAGKCADGSACLTTPGCTPDKCKPMFCETAGAADADAYCTMQDCSADADCATGFYCGITHDPHMICNTTKGNNPFCGTTNDACIAPANFADNGETLFEGSVCLLRKTCLKRVPCATCATDLDCSLTPGMHCAKVGADMHCASVCKKSTDCQPGYTCTGGSCVPRAADGCKGPGGKLCDACISDEDCGSKGTSWACVELDSLSHETGCADVSFSKACMADSDCPTSQDGLAVACMNENFGVNPGDALYHHCYLPYHLVGNPPSPAFTCW